jgi:hypothetical protein
LLGEDANRKAIRETGSAYSTQNGLEGLIAAARDLAPVSGLTHNFYRYPARFSPSFVRAAIHALSDPGDWVMDPFAGGGTTLVEALAAGRNALGIDISSLAVFVCRAKTLMLDDPDVESMRHWAVGLRQIINMHAPVHGFSEYADAGYYRHISGREYWRLRKAIEQAPAERYRTDTCSLRRTQDCPVGA